jgi:predicted SPOUT superfamily RNA methylase MTH1
MKCNVRLSIAIPDSALSDEDSKRDKSIKVSQFARACSVFRVSTIHIYHDRTTEYVKDRALIKTILRYLNTPQYLRKRLYPIQGLLEYAGILHPLIAPHHKPLVDLRKLKVGDIRVGIILKQQGKLCADAGLGRLINFKGRANDGDMVTVKFSSVYPNLEAVEALESDITYNYWGYEVKEAPNLSCLLSASASTEVLITSKSGKNFGSMEQELIKRMNYVDNLLIVFGAPKSGLFDILEREGKDIRSYRFVANMFPLQGTKTVRLEEAILGTLAIINHILT